MVLFAALVSVALASLGRRSMRVRIRYALWTLAVFLIVAVGIAWLMYPLSR
jgi:multidrug transporter EmrE-like cation transporter